MARLRNAIRARLRGLSADTTPKQAQLVVWAASLSRRASLDHDLRVRLGGGRCHLGRWRPAGSASTSSPMPVQWADATVAEALASQTGFDVERATALWFGLARAFQAGAADEVDAASSDASDLRTLRTLRVPGGAGLDTTNARYRVATRRTRNDHGTARDRCVGRRRSSRNRGRIGGRGRRQELGT